MQKLSLNIPGPSELPLEVLHAVGTQMVDARSDQFFRKAIQEIKAGMKDMLQTKNDILFFTSSGTGGMESALVNTMSPGDKVLVCVNGEFGHRFSIIAQNYGLNVEKVESRLGEPLDAKEIKAKLEKDKPKSIKAVLAIHNETSTGILNDISEIGKEVNNHGALFIVDAISSVGCTEFMADDWKVDIVITASQKGLMSPPGLCLISVSDKAWEAVERSKMPKYYWDYKLARGLFGKIEGLPDEQLPGIPITPSIALLFALQKSIELLKKEGYDNVFNRHRKNSSNLRAGLKALGLELITNEKYASPTVTAVKLPERLDQDTARKILKESYNIVIARGHKRFSKNVVRIGHIGYMDFKNIMSIIIGIEGLLLQTGYISESLLGHGTRAAHLDYYNGNI